MTSGTMSVSDGYVRSQSGLFLGWFDCTAVCVYLLSVVSLPGILWRQQILLLGVVGFFLLARLRILAEWTRPVVLITVLLFGGSIFASSYMNRNAESSFLITPLFFALALIGIFLFSAYASLMGLMGRMLSIFFILTLAVCLANDGLAIVQGIGKDGAYLLGSKFPASYAHMFLIALAYRRYIYTPRKKDLLSLWLRMIGIYTYSLFFCHYMGCNTAVIWTLGLGVCYIFQRVLLPILRKPAVVVGTLIVADSILIMNSAVVKWGPIEYLFTQMLGKSTDMTGRMPIYQKFEIIVQAASWRGVGMENNYDVSMQLTGAADLQNGLLHLLLSYGALGVCLFLVMQWICVKYIRDRNDPSMLMLIYAFIGVSMVEIPFSKFYYTVLAIAMSVSSSDIEKRLIFKHHKTERR